MVTFAPLCSHKHPNCENWIGMQVRILLKRIKNLEKEIMNLRSRDADSCHDTVLDSDHGELEVVAARVSDKDDIVPSLDTDLDRSITDDTCIEHVKTLSATQPVALTIDTRGVLIGDENTVLDSDHGKLEVVAPRVSDKDDIAPSLDIDLDRSIAVDTYIEQVKALRATQPELFTIDAPGGFIGDENVVEASTQVDISEDLRSSVPEGGN